jgi:hypothetical protein
MYYKLYRRRHRIYVAAFVIISLYFLIFHHDSQKNADKKSLGYREQELRARINIDTYKQPPPCNECPGENGAGVTLNVINIKFNK